MLALEVDVEAGAGDSGGLDQIDDGDPVEAARLQRAVDRIQDRLVDVPALPDRRVTRGCELDFSLQLGASALRA